MALDESSKDRGGRSGGSGPQPSASEPAGEAAKQAANQAKALRGRGPLELVYRTEVGERGLTQGLEHRIKRLVKADKEQLVRSAPTAGELLDRFGLK